MHNDESLLPSWIAELVRAIVIQSEWERMIFPDFHTRLFRLLLQVIRYFGELGQGGLEVLHDFGGDDIGRREIRTVF